MEIVVNNTETDGFPVTQQVDKYRHRLYIDYEYVHRNCFSIHIKKGFTYDGASIPRILWRVAGTPFTGLYTVAALVHDALYEAELFPRKECDLTFFEIMVDYKVGWFARHSKYRAVRMGGWVGWNRHTEESIAKARKLVEVH